MQILGERKGCFIGNQPHPGNLTLTKHCLELSQIPGRARILDIGCGCGQTVQFLRDVKFKSFGIDANLEKLKSIIIDENVYSMANWFFIPTCSNCFEAVFAECTFSMINALDIHLSEIYRVLRSNGKLVFHGLYSRNDDLNSWLKNIGDDCSLKHIRNQQQLVTEVQKAGFKLQFWEDQSQVLKNKEKYLNNLCWNPSLFGVPNKINLVNQNGSEMDIFDYFLTISKIKLGYYIAIAIKNDEVIDG